MEAPLAGTATLSPRRPQLLLQTTVGPRTDCVKIGFPVGEVGCVLICNV